MRKLYKCRVLTANPVKRAKCYGLNGHEHCTLNKRDITVKPVHNGNYIKHGNLLVRLVPLRNYVGA